MKSLGEMLKSARMNRGLDIEEVVHEINISRTYLEALENENFDVFPADAYLVGFLRNYAEFLGLDADKIVGQFRNYKLNEQPTPIEELVGPPKGALRKRIFLWISIIIPITAAGFFGIPRLFTLVSEFQRARADRQSEIETDLPAREIRPTPPIWEGKVRPGDTLILEDGEGEKFIEVSSADNQLILNGGSSGNWTMLLGEQLSIQNTAGVAVWEFSLNDFGLSDGGAILEVKQLLEIDRDATVDAEIPAVEPPSGDEQRRRDSRVIIQARRPDRFTLDITLRDFTLLRYKVDNQNTLQAYYANGDRLRLDASRSLTIWTSNAGALFAKIKGEDVTFGRRGEVVVAQIRWILDEAGRDYNLTLLPLY